jgi:5-methylcytosine-specific restriction endonuclease McrA
MKETFDLLVKSIQFGIASGKKYFLCPHYRRQSEKNRKMRQKYKAFLGNKKSLRDVLVKRHGSCCNICNQPLEVHEMTVDHVIPLHQHGTNQLKNLQILCKDCHIAKTEEERLHT